MTGAELQFREFFAAEYGRLRGLGYLLTGDWAQAEELAQDALVRTFRTWSRVRQHERPGAYARKVLVTGTARCCAGPLVFYQPGGHERYQDGSRLPEAAMPRTPAGPGLAHGRFPGGRAWLRTEGRVGASPTDWYVSWSYHCADGRRCPEVLTLRALHVAYRAEREAVAEAAALAERLLGSARPTGNAVAGRAHAPRPACVDGRTVGAERLVRGPVPDRGEGLAGTAFIWHFRTTGQLIPCAVRGPLGVELLDRSGRRIEVRGNGRAVSPIGDLPEATAASAGTVGTIELTMVWRNWCGDGPVRLRWLGGPVSGREPLPKPACTDPSKPSVLSVSLDPP